MQDDLIAVIAGTRSGAGAGAAIRLFEALAKA
jgi:hypothetical protein